MPDGALKSALSPDGFGRSQQLPGQRRPEPAALQGQRKGQGQVQTTLVGFLRKPAGAGISERMEPPGRRSGSQLLQCPVAPPSSAPGTAPGVTTADDLQMIAQDVRLHFYFRIQQVATRWRNIMNTEPGRLTMSLRETMLRELVQELRSRVKSYQTSAEMQAKAQKMSWTDSQGPGTISVGIQIGR